MADSIFTRKRRDMGKSISLSDAERMDRHYRYQRFFYDSTRTHYLLGRRHLIRNLGPAPNQSVLEIGCGTAWNLVRAAKLFPKTHFYGLDVSNAMLDTGRASLKRHSLSHRVVIRQGDATNFNPEALFGVKCFDLLFFSYAISMIPRWHESLEHAAAHVAPGGALHIVDFGQCDGLPIAFKRMLFAFLRHYTVTPRADLEKRVKVIATAKNFKATCFRLHRGYTEYAVLSRR